MVAARTKIRILAGVVSLFGTAIIGIALGLFSAEGDASPFLRAVTSLAADSAMRITFKSDSPRREVANGSSPKESHPRRTLQEPADQIRAADPTAVDLDDPLRNCALREAKLAPAALVTPVFAASYPGSGSRMLRHLIEALTGVATGDEWFRTTRRAVAIKTHYPHSHGTGLDFDWAGEVTSSILLLRNPRDAIPSLGNHLYERRHGMTDHSTRAPVEEWVKWRNHEFRKQLAWWKMVVEHWVDRFPADRRLIVTYEALTGKGVARGLGGGVESALKIAVFLSKSVKGLKLVPQKEMQCVWYKVVKYDEAEHEEGGVTFNSQRKDHPEGGSERPYTRWQLEEMMGVFRSLEKKYASEADVVRVMVAYQAEVKRNLDIHDSASAANGQR